MSVCVFGGRQHTRNAERETHNLAFAILDEEEVVPGDGEEDVLARLREALRRTVAMSASNTTQPTAGEELAQLTDSCAANIHFLAKMARRSRS